MKLTQEKKQRIKNAIKTLKLSKEELDEISIGTLDKIVEVSKCKLIEAMYYLRYER